MHLYEAVGVLGSDGRQVSKEFGADDLQAWPSQFLVLKGFAAAKLAEICTVSLHSSYTAKNWHIICNQNNQI
jgi:hypothetical protein